MEATLSWLCLWLQNSVRVLVLPVKICSILRITKALMKDLCILSGSTCSKQNQNQCVFFVN